MSSATYDQLKQHLSKVADLSGCLSVMHWDQETYMPPKGAAFRAQQISTLSGIAHELGTDPKIGKWLEELKADTALDPKEARNAELIRKNFERRQKYPTEFVTNQSQAISEAYQAWEAARKANDFSIYIPALSRLLDLKRKETEIVGFEGHPYDALLEEFEPGATTAEINTLFDEVRRELVPFVKSITDQPMPDNSFMHRHYPESEQWNFGLDLLRQMGYDFEAGRQDKSTHPFTIHFSPQDVRVTTRVDENDLSEMIWSCIHEGGHALYEQGLPTSEYGLPSGQYVSLGIHESQSRLWENNVGRSISYWNANFDLMRGYFPEQLADVTPKAFYKAMNLVTPSLIRTNADELTYHSHIMIRFETEKALIEGSLEVADVKEYWNARYKEYLGVDVDSDLNGVLQDIHWSHGSFGYFPTYSIGSFYAAQFYAQAEKEISDLDGKIAAGNLLPLLEWLRTNIHQYGRTFGANDLCKKVTGEELRFSHFMKYAKKKYSALYNLETTAV